VARRLPDLGRQIRRIVFGEDVRGDLEAEIDFHIEQRARTLEEQGMSPEQARREAQRRFGDTEAIRRECHAIDRRRVTKEGWKAVYDSFRKDLRHAVRSLRRSPGFAAVVILTLGLGIGANAAVFTVVRSVLLQPLPYADADRLTLVWGHMTETSVAKAPWSGPDLLDFRERADLFETFVGAFGQNSTLTGDFEPEPIQLAVATVDFFRALGVSPMLGRGFEPEDARNLDPQVLFDANATPPSTVALLSHDLWVRRFGSDPGVIGRVVRAGGQPMTVVGVLPPDFRLHLPAQASFPGSIDVWSANIADLSIGTRDAQWLTVVGRLKPGVELEQARAQMDAIASELRAEHQFHANVGMRIDVVPMRDDVVGHAEPILLALLGAVGFVLLIACANVASLLLVRGRVRQREVAIRSALGGSRRRIVQGLLIESGVYALLGGAVGLLLGFGGVELLLALRPESLPRVDSIRVDLLVLGFVFALAMISALLFGTLPALQSSKADLVAALKLRTQSGAGGTGRMRGGLVVAEVALSLVLLVGAGLMTRSFWHLTAVDPGFNPDDVLTVNVSLPFFGSSGPAAQAERHLRLQERIAALPGVEAVGAVTPLPLAGGSHLWFGPYALHEASEEEWSRNESDYRPMLPGYFESVGTKLLAGRSIQAADLREDARPVVVVDEKMAAMAWPGQSAVGKRIMVMRPGDAVAWDRYWAEVVGVVEHVRYDDIRGDGRETIYFPYTDWSWTDMNYTIRTAGDPTAVAGAVRGVIRELEPDIPVSTPRPLSDYVGEALAPTRFVLIVITFFAVIALTLAAVGLYGVISYSVRERVHEIGIRMVFGAERGEVLRMVLRQGLLLTAAGVVAGVFGSLLVTRGISSLLFGVGPADPVTFVGISLVLGAVAALACLIPALRATRVDPAVALRAD